MVKNPPASAGDVDSVPGPGRSHMPRRSGDRVPQLLSLCSRAREPQVLKPACSRARALQQENPLQREACCATAREKPAQQQRPSTAKNTDVN